MTKIKFITTAREHVMMTHALFLIYRKLDVFFVSADHGLFEHYIRHDDIPKINDKIMDIWATYDADLDSNLTLNQAMILHHILAMYAMWHYIRFPKEKAYCSFFSKYQWKILSHCYNKLTKLLKVNLTEHQWDLECNAIDTIKYYSNPCTPERALNRLKYICI